MEFQAIALGKLSDDLIEELLDYALKQGLLCLRAPGDAVDQVLLGCCQGGASRRTAYGR